MYNNNMQRNYENNINRSSSVFNHVRNKSRNLVTPEVLVNQLLKQEDTRGVKIIELNSSSDSSETNPSYGHAWSYVDNRKFEQNDPYRINEEARRRRRMNMNHTENYASAYANQYYYDQTQPHTNSFYDTYDSGINSAPIHHQRNCFTIINNQNVNSDSSTDNDNEPMEIIELDGGEADSRWHHVYNEEIVNYNSNTKTEKRTIWIYSFKNKALLSENDFELVNIPGQDVSSISSCSKSDEEQKIDKETITRRVGSPIPDAYVPRLDLSVAQTLSTVTELSEPNKTYSKESSQEMIQLKPTNNWLADKTETKQTNNSNVVNWMALSPRERRRRSINTKSNINAIEKANEAEVTYAEGIEHQDPVRDKSNKTDLSVVQVQVDIHTQEKEINGDISTRRSNESKPNKTKKIADTLPMKISFADADDDVGDNTKLDYSKRPSIKINSKLDKTAITEPIEKLHCNNWISEEGETTTVYDYDLETVQNIDATISSSENVAVDPASRRLWMRNLQLMKAPQWAEYLPITCSPPTLHLSLSLDSIDSKQSWFKRLTKCMKCCK